MTERKSIQKALSCRDVGLANFCLKGPARFVGGGSDSDSRPGGNGEFVNRPAPNIVSAFLVYTADLSYLSLNN